MKKLLLLGSFFVVLMAGGALVHAADFVIHERADWGVDESLRTETGWQAARDKYCIKAPWICQPLSAAAKQKVEEERKYYEENFPEEIRTIDRVESENGQALTWPIEHSAKVYKIVVHHTAETLSDTNDDAHFDTEDSKQMIRNMYWYHTVVRGWGDIGYNFIIDPQGNVYRGRAGGDTAVGAHVNWHNAGTIGISLMGNMTKQYPTEEQKDSLVKLAAYLSRKYQLDVSELSSFHGKMTPNLIGHRDLAATNCPGDNMYADLDGIRTAVVAIAGDVKPKYTAEVGSLPTVELSPTTAQLIKVPLKNTSAQAWTGNVCLRLNNKLQLVQIVPPILSNPTCVSAAAGNVIVGRTYDFSLNIRSLATGGQEKANFSLIINNQEVTKFDLPITVAESRTAYQVMAAPNLLSTYAGSVVQGEVILQNTGNTVWTAAGATAFKLVDSTNNLEVALTEEEVWPGQRARFALTWRNKEVGTKHYEFKARWDGLIVSGEPIVWNVEYKAAPTDQKWFGRVAYQTLVMRPGETVAWSVPLTNKNDFPWDLSAVTWRATSGEEQLTVAVPAGLDSLEPGTTGTVVLNVTAPKAFGEYYFTLTPVLAGRELLARPWSFTVRVENAAAGYQKLPHTDILAAAPLNRGTYVLLQVRNVGSQTWRTGDIKLTLGNSQKKSELADASWLKPTAPATLREAEVAPGAMGTFVFKVRPARLGRIVEELRLYMADQGVLAGEPILLSIEGTPALASTTPSTTDSAASDNEPIRIRLGYSGSSAEVGGAAMVMAGDSRLTVPSSQTCLLSVAGEAVNVRCGELSVNNKIIQLKGDILSINSWSRYPAWDTKKTENDNQFRNLVEWRVVEGKLQAINELPLHDYLAGMAEVPENEPATKKQVMAVLARTYARWYLTAERKYPGAPYDGSDDPDEFQKYLGANYEHRAPGWQAAVRTTTGLVVKYNGQLIKTPYFNQSAGVTRSAEEVWGWKNTPYLVSVPDPFCGTTERKGHGVGLSGCGARVLAEQGKSMAEIIKYYYQGVTVEK